MHPFLIPREGGWSPLHCAFINKNMTAEIVQLIIDAAPDSVRSVSNTGHTPLHYLCLNELLDGTIAIKILKLLLEKHPESIRHADDGYNERLLPIHLAARTGKSADFCRVLIEAYPDSIRVGDHRDQLPIHWACTYNTVATVQCLYNFFPDAINHATTDGNYPIHSAMNAILARQDPEAAIEIVKFLLNCDPNVKLQKCLEISLFHYACSLNDGRSNFEVGIENIKTIYDAHPEAIYDDEIEHDMHLYHQQVQAFLNTLLVYARQAKDHRQMTTPDGKGRLPLHTALQNNVILGSIKLLVNGNPTALQSPDDSGALPLHIACQHHDSLSVIQYLVRLDTTTLEAVDKAGNTALHYVCRGARHDIIALFLDEFNAVSVSKRSARKKLPIDLLWESNEVSDRESIEYTESSFRLLKAYPETVMKYDSKHQAKTNCQGQAKNGSGSLSQNVKKRKLCAHANEVFANV